MVKDTETVKKLNTFERHIGLDCTFVGNLFCTDFILYFGELKKKHGAHSRGLQSG